jgi:hypothetical protein
MLLELSNDTYQVQNHNVKASTTTGVDQTKPKATATRRGGFILQKLALILAFASILAALALSACETTEPSASPREPLATSSPRQTIEEPPRAVPRSTIEEPLTTVRPAPAPSATSSPDYTDWDVDRGVEESEPPPPPDIKPEHVEETTPPPKRTKAKKKALAKESQGASQEAVPEFPWPPPKASASDMIPRELLVGNAAHPTLGAVAQAIESAFQEAGYGEKSYYSVPGGFAMASQIEQINQDGSPKDSIDRWSLETPPMRKVSVGSYLNALFMARPGYYRVIVFVVTSKAFPQRDVKVTSEESKQWVSSGLNKLPEEIGNQEYSRAHSCTALIYEFKRPEGQHARLMEPSQITGKTHLNKAGLMSAFAKRR